MNLDIQSRAFDRRAQPRVTQSWDTHVICRCKIVLVLYNKGHRYYSLIAHQTALCMWWCLGNFKRLGTTGKWRTKHAFLAKHPHQCYHWTANKAKKALLEHYNFTNGYLIVMNLRQITQLARQTKRTKTKKFFNRTQPDQTKIIPFGHPMQLPLGTPALPWPGELLLGHSRSSKNSGLDINVPFLFPINPYKSKTTTKRQTAFHIRSDDLKAKT